MSQLQNRKRFVSEGAKMKTEGDKIKTRMLVPLSVLLVILSAVSAISVWWAGREYTRDLVATRLAGAQRLFAHLVDQEAKFVNAQMDFLKKDKTLQDLWLGRDREKLLEYAQPIFQSMKSGYRVTHIYFIEPDKTCFLRVHIPEKFGDKKKIHVLDKVIATGQASFGIELGRYGLFTLRVVHPWVIDGRLSGYMELGMEIEHLTPQLKSALHTDMIFLIDKQFLDRGKWEEGLALMNRRGDWDQFADSVVIDSTIMDIPPGVSRHLSEHDEDCRQFLTARAGGRTFFGGCMPLIDAGDRKVGRTVVLIDSTETVATMRMFMVTLVAVYVLVGGALLLFFYSYTGRIGRRLTANHDKLAEEVRQRKLIEQELRESNSRMEARVTERTLELEKANATLQEKIAENLRAQEQLSETMTTLRRFNSIAVGRELRMRELKNEVNELCQKLGLADRYGGDSHPDEQVSRTTMSRSGVRDEG
jgi:flagellar basal body-associated protein FliL